VARSTRLSASTSTGVALARLASAMLATIEIFIVEGMLVRMECTLMMWKQKCYIIRLKLASISDQMADIHPRTSTRARRTLVLYPSDVRGYLGISLVA